MKFLGSNFEAQPVSLLGQTGGTDDRVIRLSAANTWTDAANTDTTAQLWTVAFKHGGAYYTSGVITGLTGLTAGQAYWLGTAGALTSTAPTPSTTAHQLFIGFAIDTDSLVFRPGIPILGT